jgi:hypothetical protein
MPGVAGIDTLQQDITFREYAVLLHARVAILVLSDGGNSELRYTARLIVAA